MEFQGEQLSDGIAIVDAIDALCCDAVFALKVAKTLESEARQGEAAASFHFSTSRQPVDKTDFDKIVSNLRTACQHLTGLSPLRERLAIQSRQQRNK